MEEVIRIDVNSEDTPMDDGNTSFKHHLMNTKITQKLSDFHLLQLESQLAEMTLFKTELQGALDSHHPNVTILKQFRELVSKLK
jgi:hypothetical protein